MVACKSGWPRKPYTRDMYDRTHRWMEEWNLFTRDQLGHAAYEVAVAG